MCSACCGHLAAAPRGVGGTLLQAEEGKQECRRMLLSPNWLQSWLEGFLLEMLAQVAEEITHRVILRLVLRFLLCLGISGGCACNNCTL